MALAKTLKKYLDSNKIKYETKKHKAVYTAQEIAAAQHTPGDQMIKSVIIKLNGGAFYMMALPASYKIDFKKLKTAAGAKSAELAKENEFKALFPDCEVGAMPPFGNLYNVPVVIDQSIAADEKITFNAGAHNETIKMKFADFKKLVNPKVVSFAVHI